MPTVSPLISAIIPTVHRASTERSVSSALAQRTTVEVILVDDSAAQDLRSPVDDPRVRVVRSGGLTGAANARNVGLGASRGDFIAFLDDDDEWLDGHLDRALAVLEKTPTHDIYSCRALVRAADGSERLEPIDLLAHRSLWDYTYGWSSCWGRARRVVTPTLVFRSSLRGHLMDPSLTWAEDTWWLLTAEDKGHRLLQDPNVGALVHASGCRRRGRELDARNLQWAQRLNARRPRSGVMHLAALGRTAAKEGQVAEVVRRAVEARTLRGSLPVMPVFAAEIGLAVVAAGARRILGRLGRAGTWTKADV